LACPIDDIGASACRIVAFSGFYESDETPPASGNARSIIPPHPNGHQNGQQSGYNLLCSFVECRPGVRRGNTEGVVTRWQHPVAYGEALVMLHQAMPSVLLQCVCMAIEMACEGGAFIRHRRLFCLL